MLCWQCVHNQLLLTSAGRLHHREPHDVTQGVVCSHSWFFFFLSSIFFFLFFLSTNFLFSVVFFSFLLPSFFLPLHLLLLLRVLLLLFSSSPPPLSFSSPSSSSSPFFFSSSSSCDQITLATDQYRVWTGPQLSFSTSGLWGDCRSPRRGRPEATAHNMFSIWSRELNAAHLSAVAETDKLTEVLLSVL